MFVQVDEVGVDQLGRPSRNHIVTGKLDVVEVGAVHAQKVLLHLFNEICHSPGLKRLMLQLQRLLPLWRVLASWSARMLSLATSKGVFLCTSGACTLGFGSLNHGLWPLKKVFGTPNPRLQTLRVQT